MRGVAKRIHVHVHGRRLWRQMGNPDPPVLRGRGCRGTCGCGGRRGRDEGSGAPEQHGDRGQPGEMRDILMVIYLSFDQGLPRREWSAITVVRADSDSGQLRGPPLAAPAGSARRTGCSARPGRCRGARSLRERAGRAGPAPSQRKSSREFGRSVPAAVTRDGHFPVQRLNPWRGIAERGHAEGILGRQRRERRQHAGIHLTRPQLRGVLRGEADTRVSEQLRPAVLRAARSARRADS